MGAHYSREHEAILRRGAAVGAALRCPVCDRPMDVQSVVPRADVAYVRSRQWLRCAECRRSLVLDTPRGDRP